MMMMMVLVPSEQGLSASCVVVSVRAKSRSPTNVVAKGLNSITARQGLSVQCVLDRGSRTLRAW
jgi:hypothetical protein